MYQTAVNVGKSIRYTFRSIMSSMFGRHWMYPGVGEPIDMVHLGGCFDLEVGREEATIIEKERILYLDADGAKVYWYKIETKSGDIYQGCSGCLYFNESRVWEMHK